MATLTGSARRALSAATATARAMPAAPRPPEKPRIPWAHQSPKGSPSQVPSCTRTPSVHQSEASWALPLPAVLFHGKAPPHVTGASHSLALLLLQETMMTSSSTLAAGNSSTWQFPMSPASSARASSPSFSSSSFCTSTGANPGRLLTPAFSEASCSYPERLDRLRAGVAAPRSLSGGSTAPSQKDLQQIDVATDGGASWNSRASRGAQEHPSLGSSAGTSADAARCASMLGAGSVTLGHKGREIPASGGCGHLAAHGLSSAAAWDEKPVVGFIGLGNMGAPMASNVLKAGFPLVAYDSKQAATDNLVLQGATSTPHLQELAHRADIIVTMLPSPEAVLEVYTGPSGFFSSASPFRTALFIDSSTVDPATAGTVAEAGKHCTVLKGSKLAWEGHPRVLDAPVSGGVPGARGGTLSFMVGGDKGAFEVAEPLLSAMGRKAVFCGPSGSGSAAKLCNNLALAIQMAGVAEALALGQRLGLDPSLLSSIFNSSSARCWSSDTYNPAPRVMENVPSANDYKGGFTCALMQKDLKLALEAAQSTEANVTMGKTLQDMYNAAVSAGLYDKDFSVIYSYIYGGKPASGSE